MCVARATTASMPRPRLNTWSISSSETSPAGLDLGEDPGLFPRATADHARRSRSGSTRTRLPGMPPPVTCANPWTGTSRARARASRARRSRSASSSSSASEWCAPGHAGSSSRRPARSSSAATRERVAVAAQPRARDADDAVAGAHVAGQHLGPFDDADRETDEVELARLHHARVLRHLAAEQRAARARGILRRHPPRSRRSPRGRACRSRCSRGRTAARRRARRCRRPTWRRSRCRSCCAGSRAGRSSDFVPTPSVDETSSGSRYRFQSTANSPPKPPTSPTTSGRNVERTCALISSTAFSPAAMSTPDVGVGERLVRSGSSPSGSRRSRAGRVGGRHRGASLPVARAPSPATSPRARASCRDRAPAPGSRR